MEQILKKHSSSPPLRKWNLSIHLNHQKKKKERLEESTLGTWNRRKRKRTSGWREKGARGEARSCWPRGWYWMLGGTAVGGGSLTSWQEHKETRSGGSGREEGWFGEEEASRCSASDGGSPDRVGRGMKETPLADPTLRTKASLCLLPPLWKRDHLYYPARLSWTFLRLYLCICVCERASVFVCKARYIQDFGRGYYTGASGVRVEFVRGDRGTSKRGREGPNIESCWLGSETVFN